MSRRRGGVTTCARFQVALEIVAGGSLPFALVLLASHFPFCCCSVKTMRWRRATHSSWTLWSLCRFGVTTAWAVSDCSSSSKTQEAARDVAGGRGLCPYRQRKKEDECRCL